MGRKRENPLNRSVMVFFFKKSALFLNNWIIAPLCLVWVRAPLWPHVRQAKFCLRVCQVVFLGVLPLLAPPNYQLPQGRQCQWCYDSDIILHKLTLCYNVPRKISTTECLMYYYYYYYHYYHANSHVKLLHKSPDQTALCMGQCIAHL